MGTTLHSNPATAPEPRPAATVPVFLALGAGPSMEPTSHGLQKKQAAFGVTIGDQVTTMIDLKRDNGDTIYFGDVGEVKGLMNGSRGVQVDFVTMKNVGLWEGEFAKASQPCRKQVRFR